MRPVDLLSMVLTEDVAGLMKRWAEWWNSHSSNLLPYYEEYCKTMGWTAIEKEYMKAEASGEDAKDNPRFVFKGKYEDYKMYANHIVEEPTDTQLAAGSQTLGVGHWLVEISDGTKILYQHEDKDQYDNEGDVSHNKFGSMLLRAQQFVDDKLQKNRRVEFEARWGKSDSIYEAAALAVVEKALPNLKLDAGKAKMTVGRPIQQSGAVKHKYVMYGDGGYVVEVEFDWVSGARIAKPSTTDRCSWQVIVKHGGDVKVKLGELNWTQGGYPRKESFASDFETELRGMANTGVSK